MFKLISESVNLCKIQSFLKLQHFCYAVAKTMAIEKSYGARGANFYPSIIFKSKFPTPYSPLTTLHSQPPFPPKPYTNAKW
jgi:hypothetical protein